MSFVRNRELSQFGSFLYIDNATQNIGITTTGTPYVGIGTDNPTSLLTVGGDVNISGILTASSFVVGDGSSSGFLKANGTVDTNTYTTSIDNTLDSVTNNGNTTTNNITVGDITANSFIGSGSNLSGIVTSIIAGTNITISGSTGEVTINALGWVTTASGIHTTSNVGVGTTNPTSKLTVEGDVSVSGVVTATDFNSTSDITLKTNINQIENSLDKIVYIRGVNFEWKKDHRQSAGVIAQEVEKVFPELVSTGEHKTVNYNGIIGVLIEAIKELKSEVEELKNKIQ